MIHVLLPVHNRRATPEVFARALTRQGVEFHLLLIDDGSTDGPPKRLRRCGPVAPRDDRLWLTPDLAKTGFHALRARPSGTPAANVFE